MNSKQRRRAGASQLARDRHVRQNHAFLNQAVRLIALHEVDRRHAFGRIESEACLRGIEIERATLVRAL